MKGSVSWLLVDLETFIIFMVFVADPSALCSVLVVVSKVMRSSWLSIR